MAVSIKIGVWSPSRRKPLADVIAMHVRKHQIEDDHVELAGLGKLDAFGAGWSDGDAVVFGAQAAVDEIGDARLILDEKHVHAGVSGAEAGSATVTVVPSPTRLSICDPAFMGLDDGLGDGQAEAQALLHYDRGVAAPAKALENAVELLRRYADAVVGDAHPNLAVRLAIATFTSPLDSNSARHCRAGP